MANILGKILSGVAQGGLDHMRDKRRRKEEEKDWNLRKSHKRELLDMQDEYHVKRENRRRENRLADDERRYNTSLKREQEYQNKKLTEIQELFPERWENPQFQQEVTAAIKGVKVPRLPANKKIAELAMSGKVDEAMKLAYGSSNVEDQDFFKSVVTAISSRKKLDKLLHPEKYQTARPKSYMEEYGFFPDKELVANSLDQGQEIGNSILSKVLNIPGGSDSMRLKTPVDLKKLFASKKEQRKILKDSLDRGLHEIKGLTNEGKEIPQWMTDQVSRDKEALKKIERDMLRLAQGQQPLTKEDKFSMLKKITGNWHKKYLK